jgi:hypothetical protein
MNFSDLFRTAFINAIKQYWYIWPVLILFFILISALKIILTKIGKKVDKKISGFGGEKLVASILKKLNPEEYKVINNKTLYVDKESAQIDHLVISNYGIFVIETKNFEGIIFGEENSNYWTQVIYKNRENFYNPIRQNNWHIQALKNILVEYPDIVYFPIVVFTKSSDLRIKTVTDVVNTDDLIKTIRKHQTENILDLERDKIYNYLK